MVNFLHPHYQVAFNVREEVVIFVTSSKILKYRILIRSTCLLMVRQIAFTAPGEGFLSYGMIILVI
jgi:hypothetical protein